jgi:hypothetical protein
VSSVSNCLYFLTVPLVSVMRVICTSKVMSKKFGGARYKLGARYLSKNTVCVYFFFFFLLACSITLVISNTTCYLQMLFTLLFILLSYVFFWSLPCIVVVLLLFHSVSCVSFLNFVHPFCEFYKCFVVFFL